MKHKNTLLHVVLVAMIKLSVLFVFRIASPVPPVALSAPASSEPGAGPGDPQQYPVMEMIANKVVQKYQQATCEQLWQERAQKGKKPESPMEQRALEMLKSDPQMRSAFINKVAAPIANKMFECGMIP